MGNKREKKKEKNTKKAKKKKQREREREEEVVLKGIENWEKLLAVREDLRAS